MQPAAAPMWKRFVPVLKVLVAAALIAFLVWLVPFRDHLKLAASDPAADREFMGEVVERNGDLATFVVLEEAAGVAAGTVIRVELAQQELVVRARFDGGGTYEPPADLPPERVARLEQGLITTIANARISLLMVTFALILLANVVAAYRWHLLLKGPNLDIGFGRAFSFTFIGTFFNNIMPGLTGGDVVKAVYIARHHPRQKTEAIITVLLDRVLGITGLALVAALVIPFELKRYGEVAPWIFGLLLAVALAACVFFSRRLRALLRIDAIVARLPFSGLMRRIDQGVFLYRFRKRLVLASLLLSMVVHLMIIGGIGVIGVALGLDLDFSSYFAVVPIGLIAMALPITPSGWGFGEAAFVYFWGTVGVGQAHALSLALLYRILQLAVSLIGGVCLMLEKDKVTRQDMDDFAGGSGGSLAQSL